MMAVISPIVGLTPLAMPNAMASGSATMPTTMPAMRSSFSHEAEYPLSEVSSFGLKSIVPDSFISVIFFTFFLSAALCGTLI